MKKHIVIYGDSNTHGYCADPTDCADGGDRFNEEERFPCLLQKALGEEYLILEEGLGGRAAVSDDPLTEGLNGLSTLNPILMSHEPVDLLIVMLGTNDVKERLCLSPGCVANGLVRLFKKAMHTECWGKGSPKILYVCPPHITEALRSAPCAATMGTCCIEKSALLAGYIKPLCEDLGVGFIDADGCEFNPVDGMHLTKNGHRKLAELLEPVIRNYFI